MLTFLRRLLTKFLHLQWKLTFSYILVTAVGLIVMIVVAILVLVQFVVNQYPQDAADVLQGQAKPVLDHLEQPASHQSLIDELMIVEDILQDVYLVDLNTESDAVVEAYIPTQRGYTVIIDPHGWIVASSDPEAMPEGGLLSTKWSADGMRVVHEANKSNVYSQPIVRVNCQQRLYAAIPLFNRDRERLGLLVTTQVVPSWGQIVIVLFQLFWPTLVLITCIVSIIGALFGFVVSRWLVRRFMKVIQATRSWSQGEFSPIMADRPDDEFSMITRLLTKCCHLQWKLTSSYILVTAVGLITAIVVAILVLVQCLINQYPQSTSSTLQMATPNVVDLLEESTNPQRLFEEMSSGFSGRLDGPFQTASDSLIDELLSIDGGGYLDRGTGAVVVIDTSEIQEEYYTVITDPHGRVLTSTDPETMPEGSLLSTKWSADGMRVVHAANKSDADSQPIVFVNHQQRLYAAIPLFNNDRERLGLLVTTYRLPNWGQTVVALLLSPLLWPTLVLIICIVSIIGAFFGSVVSRWLVRRFMKVIQTTKSWSQGDFSLIIADLSDDEFGVMTHQLNTMARKLEHLLRERQNIAMLEERNRVARDLHDSLKQQIFAISMQVWSVQSLLDTNISAAKVRLATIEQLLEQTLQELSMLIHQLRPVILADKQFSAALRDYCVKWARERNIVLDLHVAEVDLSLSAEEALFRITQEALANVARHSNASTVQVRLLDQQEQVLLSITDNGQGFDLDQAREWGVGLHSMRERMEKLQGTLSIVSKCGHGTIINATYTKGRSSK